MNASYITLILNLLLVLFVVLGFLWGISRGAKKSALRLTFFIVFVVIAALITTPVTNALLGIKISIGGSTQSIEAYLTSLVSSFMGENAGIGGIYDGSSALQQIILKLPLMIANVLVFVVLMLVMKFISWIIYAIVAKIAFGKKKKSAKFAEPVPAVAEGQPIVLTEVKQKKHRLLGGLISAVQATVFLFLLLIPVSGIVGTVNSVANQTTEVHAQTVYAEGEEQELTESAKLIRSILPEIVLEYTGAYSDSITVKFFNLGNFDLLCFDSLTSAKINNEKIVPRLEINAVADIYNDLSYFLNLDFNNIVYADLNFENLEKIVARVLDSGLFRIASTELLNYFVQNYTETQDFSGMPVGSQLESILETIKNDIASDTYNFNSLKEDILAMLGVLKVLCTQGIIDLATSENIDDSNLISTLSANNAKIINDVLLSAFQSPTLKNVISQSINLAYAEVEKQLQDMIENQDEEGAEPQTPTHVVSLDRVSSSTLKWNTLRVELCNLVVSVSKIYDSVKDIINSTPIKDIDFDTILPIVGSMLNNLKTATFVQDTVQGENILNQILDEFNFTTYSKYADFSMLKNVNWQTESQMLLALANAGVPLLDINDETIYSELDYATILSALTGAFDSAVMSAIYADVLDFVIDAEMLGYENQPLVQKVCNYLLATYSMANEMKSEVMGLLNGVSLLATAGAIDFVLKGDTSLIDTLVENLKTIDEGKEQTKISEIVDELFASDAFKIILVELLNTKVLPTMNTETVTLGQIDKTLEWEDWDIFNEEIKIILNAMLSVMENIGNEDIMKIQDDFFVLINDNFANTATDVGTILDTLATMDLLRYGENQGLTIYDELITVLFGENLTLKYALSDNYEEGFWATELGLIADALMTASIISIGEGDEQQSMLSVIISGNENLLSFVEDATISDEQYDIILGALAESKLFKQFTVQILNELNKSIVNLVDETYNQDAVNIDTDIASEKETFIAVFKALLPLTCVTSPQYLIDNFMQLSTDLNVLLQAMQDSYNNNGIFSYAYGALSEFLTDTESLEEIVGLIIDIIGEGLYGEDLSDYDWEAILEQLNEYLKGNIIP